MLTSNYAMRNVAHLTFALLLSLSACKDSEDNPGETNDKGASQKAGDTGRFNTGDKGDAAGGGKAGSHAADGGADGRVDPDPMLGSTGLHVSDVLGFYSGDWGDMILRRQGDEIWGAYTHDEGTITGTIDAEGVFVGWWSEVPSREPTNDAGDVEFRWARGSGKAVALDGRWRYGASGDWKEDWDVDLVTDRSPPSSLSDRFSDRAAFKQHP